ncbi:hypothetical protein EVAR_85379_1 [Eumeta japonica]|uniref:Uncharacterized protein n=1 Tax=Eumeta variegata TaxID=151549 RepID=A0A4C1WRE8_EUMVA|nr:hypothetical protein EVAR_85379_1 [Eumeta japonica]
MIGTGAAPDVGAAEMRVAITQRPVETITLITLMDAVRQTAGGARERGAAAGRSGRVAGRSSPIRGPITKLAEIN